MEGTQKFAYIKDGFHTCQAVRICWGKKSSKTENIQKYCYECKLPMLNKELQIGNNTQLVNMDKNVSLPNK